MTKIDMDTLGHRIFWVRQNEKQARNELISKIIIAIALPGTIFSVWLFCYMATHGMLK